MNYVVLSIEILVCLLILSLAILNVYRPKKWIKYSLVGVIIGIIISIMIVDVTIIDAIIYKVIEYLYFPPYEEYVLTIVLTVLILIFNILNSKIKNKYRIINGIFFYFYADICNDKSSKLILLSIILLSVFSILKILFNIFSISKIFDFVHISLAYLTLIIVIMNVYGSIKYKY